MKSNKTSVTSRPKMIAVNCYGHPIKCSQKMVKREFFIFAELRVFALNRALPHQSFALGGSQAPKTPSYNRCRQISSRFDTENTVICALKSCCLSLVFGSVICSNLCYIFWLRESALSALFMISVFFLIKTLSSVLYDILGKII